MQLASRLQRHHQSIARQYHLRRHMSGLLQRAPLKLSDGPLVWIDCEMTGLNPDKHKIMEIAVLITNGNLVLVDEGLQRVIKIEKTDLDAMDEWCTRQHGSSGLTTACLKSPHTLDSVKSSVLSYIKRWIPEPHVGVLAGSSVHADRAFLVKHMTEVTDWLHYRIVDVSSVKELARRWYPNLPSSKPVVSSHRALDDIKGSIQELRGYRETIFIRDNSLVSGCPRAFHGESGAQ